MPVKRRNHGRQKKNRGSVNVIQCVQCGAVVPKDKAVSRTSNKPVIENATLDDLNTATIYEAPEVPTVSITENHCVSCACHLRVVRARSKEARTERYAIRQRSE